MIVYWARNLSNQTAFFEFIKKSKYADLHPILQQNNSIGNQAVFKIYKACSIFCEKNQLKNDHLSWLMRSSSPDGFRYWIRYFLSLLKVNMPCLVGRDFLAKFMSHFIVFSGYEEVTKILTTTEELPPELELFSAKYNIPIHRYLVSWDHPSKLKQINRKHTYLVYTKDLEDDIRKATGMNSKVIVVGSLLFSFARELRQSKSVIVKNQNSIYFMASYGHPELVKQEIFFTNLFFKEVLEKKLRVIFRCYPFLDKSWLDYITHNLDPRIIIEHSDITKTGKLDLINKLDNFERVYHLGTTASYELCDYGVPIHYIYVKKYQNYDWYSTYMQFESKFKDPFKINTTQQQLHHQKYFKSNLKPFYNETFDDVSNCIQRCFSDE
jgi:hypothetical protein